MRQVIIPLLMVATWALPVRAQEESQPAFVEDGQEEAAQEDTSAPISTPPDEGSPATLAAAGATPACVIQTPLPPNVTFADPDANLPPETAAFAGVWEGTWDFGRQSRIAVQRIDASTADTTYSYGAYQGQPAGYVPLPGALPSGDRLRIEILGTAYTFTMESDLGNITGRGPLGAVRVRMTRCAPSEPSSGAPSVAAIATPAPVTPQPGPGNQVVPLFAKPFAGEWQLANPFDHDLPFEFPTPQRPADANGFLLTWWGERISAQGHTDGHFGIDWLMPEGTPLLAVADGMVTYAREHDVVHGCPPALVHPPGRTVVLAHALPGSSLATYESSYDHLSRMDVHEGQLVRRGDQIAFSGNTGCTGGPHLHFEALRGVGQAAVRIDPYGWDGPGPDPWAQHPAGATSQWLWLPGQAPLIFGSINLPPRR